MHAIDGNGWQLAQLKHRLGIKGAALGVGGFGRVYRGTTPNSVIKITSDPAYKDYLRDGWDYGLDKFNQFPKVVNLHEKLNDDIWEWNWFVVELELLQRIPAASPAKLQRTVLQSLQAKCNYADLRINGKLNEKAEAAYQAHFGAAKYDELVEFMNSLATFAADYTYKLDTLAGGNSMMNAAGDVVITDPVFDVKHQELVTRRRRGH